MYVFFTNKHERLVQYRACMSRFIQPFFKDSFLYSEVETLNISVRSEFLFRVRISIFIKSANLYTALTRKYEHLPLNTNRECIDLRF